MLLWNTAQKKVVQKTMRLRRKPWAIPEMEESPYCCLDAEEREGSWSSWFDRPDQPLYLELGCGKGRFLYEIADAHPDINFLGIDLETNAMISAKRGIEERKLGNARLLRHDINRIDGLFPGESISGLFINFCNPWPKKKHHKRRLTHPRQLLQYQRFLKEKGKLYFKTDDEELYQASLAYLPPFGFPILKSTDHLAAEDDPFGIISEYEERWRSQGIPIKSILAERRAVPEAELKERLERFTIAEKKKRNHQG